MATETATLGERIRRFRRQGGLSLKQMADATHISLGFLSMLENNKHDISIGKLLRIASFLSVDIRALMPALDLPTVIHTPANAPRERVRLAEGNVEISVLTNGEATSMLPMVVALQPGATLGEPSSHHGQEFTLILDGEVTVRVGTQDFTLRQGDSLYYEAMLPHSFSNLTTRPARFVSVSNSSSRQMDIAAIDAPANAPSMIKTTKILRRAQSTKPAAKPSRRRPGKDRPPSPIAD
jgi:transcriptional regulator with XRE-family HTH domain